MPGLDPGMTWSRSRLHRTLHTGINCIERRRAADIESVPLLTAEAQIGDSFRDVNLAEQFTASGVAAHAVLLRIAPTHGAPDASFGIATDAVGNAGLGHVRKDLAVRRLTTRDIQVKHADVRGVVGPVCESGVADIELLLVR